MEQPRRRSLLAASGVLLRQRLLMADGMPVELGTRAFELLLALLEADGALVPKKELLARVWPGVVVAQDNLKVQVFAVRRALGEDRDFIRTEAGRGYRFIAAIRSTVGWSPCRSSMRQRRWSTELLFSRWITRRPPRAWSVTDRFGIPCVAARLEGAASRRD